MSKRKEYLNKKKKRYEMEGESITEEIVKNIDSNKSSTPKNTNSENTSSTPLDKNKSEELYKRPSNDYLNKIFAFFQKQIDDLKEEKIKDQIQLKAQIDDLQKDKKIKQKQLKAQQEQLKAQKAEINTLKSQVEELNDFFSQVNLENY